MSTLKHLSSTNSPKIKDQVIVTFLNDKFLASSKLDLGQYALDKKITESHSIPVEAYEDLNKYNLQDHGFVTVQLDDTIWNKLNIIIDESDRLNSQTKIRSEFENNAQTPINDLIEWVRNYYSIWFNIPVDELIVVSSKNIVVRRAGCSAESCNIPANPLIHLDYIDFDKTYIRQCLDQEKYKYKTICPERKDLIDVINIWFPTSEVQDWPLGFIPLDITDIPDYIPIQLVSDSYAASMRYKDNLRIIYKKNMKPKEAYLFRSATDSQDVEHKKGVMHSSFRITDENFIRKSAELRFLIFRKQKLINRNVVLKGGYNRKDKYIKRSITRKKNT